MNQRVELLAQQAESLTSQTAVIGTDEWKQLYNQTFAELLVLECERVAKDPFWYDESPSCGWRNPIRHVCKRIREYFGVEQ
jgi:hypothetical protein